MSTSDISPLSLHDALPICRNPSQQHQHHRTLPMPDHRNLKPRSYCSSCSRRHWSSFSQRMPLVCGTSARDRTSGQSTIGEQLFTKHVSSNNGYSIVTYNLYIIDPTITSHKNIRISVQHITIAL